MKNSGIADEMKILPEFEFYLFDDVTWNVEGRHIGATVDAKQSFWNSNTEGHGVVVQSRRTITSQSPLIHLTNAAAKCACI